MRSSVDPSPTAASTADDRQATLFLHATDPQHPRPLAGVDALRAGEAALERLAQCGRAVERLRDDRWYLNLPIHAHTRLVETPAATLFVQLYEHASSGVLIARNRHARDRVVAVSAGNPVVVACHHMQDRLGAFLVRQGLLSASSARDVQRAMVENGRPLGWALLHLGVLNPDALLRAEQDHAARAVQEVFTWVEGELAWRESAAVAELPRVIDASLPRLLRQAYAHVPTAELASLREVTAPLFVRNEVLRWSGQGERLAPLCDGVHGDVVALAAAGRDTQALSALIATHDAPQQARDLADVYFLTQIGILGFAGERPTPRLAPVVVEAPRLAGADPLQEYQAQQQALAAAKRALQSFRPADARDALRPRTVGTGDPPIEVVAYLAIALALTGDPEGASAMAQQALRRAPQDALAHAAMARACEAAGNPAQAIYHHKTALGLSQNNPVWYREVQAALAVVANAADTKTAQLRDGRGVLLWVVALALPLVLFALANVFRMGAREYYYDPRDGFFFVRRLTLAAVGLAGLCAWQGANPVTVLRGLPWKVSGSSLQGLIMFGLMVGLLSPSQKVSGTLQAVMLLSLLHVACEELFFRGFVTRLLLDQIDDERLAILLSGIFYGAYHMTYYSFWAESGWQVRVFYVGLIAAFAGVPYAWLYARTKTLTAPLLCHAVVSCAMMALSIYRRH